MSFNKAITCFTLSCANILEHATRFDAKGEEMFCDELKSSSPLEHRLGVEKTKTEIRVTGGLLIVLGVACIISAMPTTDSHLMGNVGVEQVAGLKLPTIFASCYQILTGVGAVGFGVPFLIAAPFSKRTHTLTKWSVICNQFHLVGFVLACIVLLQGGVTLLDGTDNTTETFTTLSFHNGTDDNMMMYDAIPPELNPVAWHIRLVKVLGVCNFGAICYPLVAGLKLAYLHALAHMAGKAVNKHRGSFLFSYFIYNFLCPLLSGFSQLVLGIFLHVQFGPGPYERPFKIAFLTVYMPSITYIIGFVQIIWAIFGLFRFREMKEVNKKPPKLIDLDGNKAPLRYGDNSYMVLTGVVWFLTIALQVMVQTIWSRGQDSSLADGPVYASAGIGLFLIPVWLDYKVRTTASRIDRREFSLPEDIECQDTPQQKFWGLGEAAEEDEMDTSVEFGSDDASSCDGVYIEDRNGTDDSISESISYIRSVFSFEM